jgi:pimeloyl-ACP methyl ester carboxylesterase
VRARRTWLKTAAAALAVAALVGCAPGENAQAEPGLLAKLPDGRSLNFRCTGSGSPVVLLESGFGVGAAGWGRTQPRLAKITRVCSYDRAGYDFSDPGPEPRDGAAIARDLDQGLAAAGLVGPYILVGHSAGGLYARLFAARRPGEVQGLILLDPTIERLAPPAADGLAGIRRRLQRCLAASQASPQPGRDDPKWAGCIPAKADAHALQVAQRPATWRNQLSELDAIFGRTSEQVLRLGEILSDVPAYVITASDTAASAPTVGYDKPQSLWELQHVRLALAFDRGFQRTLLSSHLLQNDRPEVIAEAVQAMVTAARAGTPPEPLPASETAQSAGEAAFPEAPR